MLFLSKTSSTVWRHRPTCWRSTVLDTATEENWLDHPIRVASAEGLILLKLLAFRTQDLLDIENLIAARRDTLDVDWIRSEWLTVAPVEDPRMKRFMELISRG
jgi:hypothetical protein